MAPHIDEIKTQGTIPCLDNKNNTGDSSLC